MPTIPNELGIAEVKFLFSCFSIIVALDAFILKLSTHLC